MWNGPPGFRPTKSAPASPAKPLGVARTRSDSFHVAPAPKVPVGDSPYVRAKNVQLVEKDPEKAIPLFWAAINAGDRVDSALKDMAIVMKQQNRAEEAIEAIKSLRNRCSDQAQEALDNILLDLYKRCGRLDDQIALLRHKLFMIQQGLAFNGKRTKTARSQGKKFQVSVDQEATRLLGNLGWALMQQSNYIEAEDAYRRALAIAADNNKMCNLGICLMQQGRVREAKDTLRRVKPAVSDGPRGVDSHLKAYERAQQMLQDLESVTMVKPPLNSLNINAPPFYSSFKEPLKRTRSGNGAATAPENKMRRQSISPEEEKWADLKLPDNKDFEDAIIAAVLDSSSAETTTTSKLEQQHCPPRKIEKRLKGLENGESLQVLHYEVGQKYEPHYDYFADEFNIKNGGQRVATLLMYLSDVEEGGETVFPDAKGNVSAVPWWDELSECGKSGLSIKPKMGDALLFWSMKPDASPDPSSLHGGCPVIKGNKWSSTKWMRFHEYQESLLLNSFHGFKSLNTLISYSYRKPAIG
nr:protein POLLENLESS 3-LIKE 2 [Ipomoea batatas]